MKKIDFAVYSLVLVSNEKKIFQSSLSGLRPLMECVKTNYSLRDCTLYDRVIGLAAARIIIHSGMISNIITPLTSGLAKKLLEENNIAIRAEKIVERILNKDKTAACPMETKALEAKSNEEFFKFMKMRD